MLLKHDSASSSVLFGMCISFVAPNLSAGVVVVCMVRCDRIGVVLAWLAFYDVFG